MGQLLMTVELNEGQPTDDDEQSHTKSVSNTVLDAVEHIFQ